MLFMSLLIISSKKHFKEELVMTKKDDENVTSSTKSWICGNSYVDGDVRVRNHWHNTGKYGGSAHRDRNIKPKLNRKIPIVFLSLKHYAHMMQELDKYVFEINVIPTGVGKYMSFSINKSIFEFFIKQFS